MPQPVKPLHPGCYRIKQFQVRNLRLHRHADGRPRRLQKISLELELIFAKSSHQPRSRYSIGHDT